LTYPLTHVEEDAIVVRQQTREVTHELPIEFTTKELSLLASINQYRMRNGLTPLQPSNELHEIALNQATYLQGLGDIPNDVHRDANGQYWRDRAAAIGWPHYGNVQQMNVGEIIYIGASERAAMNWWQASDIHNQTILNASYREAGVAGVPHGDMIIYVVNFGSRPGVLPVMVDPTHNELVLTSELYTYAHIGEWIKNVTHYQVIPDVGGTPAENAWQDYRSTIPLEFNERAFSVALTDGEYQIVVDVDPQADYVWIPEDLSIFTEVAEADDR
jgi:uncharacterized protein YkwD